MTALLEVQNLRVRLRTAAGPAEAVRGLSFALQAGDTLGLVGESGCGKSLTALALMGLLPEGAEIEGSIRFKGQDLLALDDEAYSRLRGDRIAMIFQEPMTALNPLHRIGRQVAEPLILHQGLSRAEALTEAVRLLDRVGLADARRRAEAYPHQLSGGQRQRVGIAMALACGPELLIADEPTTALDVTIQGQILELIAGLVEERGMGLILISHDLDVVAENVRSMLVMYGGQAVEAGPTSAVFERMGHPYTQGLFAARPRLGVSRGQRLQTIAGTVPGLRELPAGCAFSARCPLAEEACQRIAPPAERLGEGHDLRCLRLAESLHRAPQLQVPPW
ncbi:ABC transporter ATP-binding protein [Roseateles toxinivorans]|uniref:Peptide/nickel transport system ATP-binding protein n=1 Tax=Roseateles toxinivorans TaxID=270368 RepID=A0A4R6QGU2_9BURK|nr:ABC transporter ATP-binding protein [Roseateles toxinivorans]TDP61659.1 peptide/nickel transport system ATP-binding protein [Roseateles toxinivorans]